MTKIAIALGGFGGFNLHGAGILESLRRLDLTPDLFTVTSGQIVVLAEWLKGADVLKLMNPASGGPLRTLSSAVRGQPGIFRAALQENVARWLDMPLTPMGVIDRLLPARRLVPVRSPERFADIAATLNGTDVGVIFNTYDFRSGDGILHGNDSARALMPDEPLAPISAEAVESALWLYLYGFDEAPNGRIDGAYHRSIILSELHAFDEVFVACPFPTHWDGPPPANSLDVEDWKVKQWFSNSYRAEVARLRRVIDLIRRGSLKDPAYRLRQLTEIPIRSRWGYFDYFIEKAEVFEDSLADGLAAFSPLAMENVAPRRRRAR